jgi:hypothetical protein
VDIAVPSDPQANAEDRLDKGYLGEDDIRAPYGGNKPDSQKDANRAGCGAIAGHAARSPWDG